MPKTVNILIPFVRVEASQNPNLQAADGVDHAVPYYKAMLVAFSSVRRFNEMVQLTLIVNEPPPAPFLGQLLRLGVDIRETPFLHRPPEGFSQRFLASLFLLDALDSLTCETSVIIDPDVLCVRPLEEMLSRVNGSVGAIAIDYSPDHNINGISRRQASELHGLLGETSELPIHFGGELYVIPEAQVNVLRQRCDAAWAFALERHAMGLTKFSTEEHILSYAFRAVNVCELSEFARRIWTAHRLRQVNGLEENLTLWHLPAEKDRGFALLYPDAVDEDSWFWKSSREEFVDRAGRSMGFHHRSVKRVAFDILASSAQRLKSKLESRNGEAKKLS